MCMQMYIYIFISSLSELYSINNFIKEKDDVKLKYMYN